MTIQQTSLLNDENIRFALQVIKSGQQISFQALRLIHFVIYKIICNEKDFQTYSGSVTELASYFNIPRNNIYRDIDELSSQLHSCVLYLGTDDPRKKWKTITWLSKSMYDGKGTVLIKLSQSMIPYVKGIKELFSEEFFQTIMKFHSRYSIRLYEILCADYYFTRSKKLTYSIEELRKYLGCENKYALYKDFKKRVIDVGIQDINENNKNFFITPTAKKKGRKVSVFVFELSERRITSK